MLEVDEILQEVESHGAHHVCVTGGEPLLQKEIHALMTRLCDLDYRVSLETSGDVSCTNVDPRVFKVVDVKTPDSGEPGKFHEDNLSLDPVNTEFKFVICSERDFLWAENFANQNNLFKNFCVLFSPSYGVVSENWLAKKILSAKSSARLQLQLHKYIWSPDQRGV